MSRFQHTMCRGWQFQEALIKSIVMEYEGTHISTRLRDVIVPSSLRRLSPCHSKPSSISRISLEGKSPPLLKRGSRSATPESSRWGKGILACLVGKRREEEGGRNFLSPNNQTVPSQCCKDARCWAARLKDVPVVNSVEIVETYSPSLDFSCAVYRDPGWSLVRLYWVTVASTITSYQG